MNKSHFLNFCLICLLSLWFGNVSGQKTANVWGSQRKVFNTIIYKDGDIQYNKAILKSYHDQAAYKSISLYNKARIFLPASPVFVLGGTYLGYDAIKGTKKMTEIDGVSYTYYVRPIKQLIAGIGMFAIGVCLLEYSNEFKAKSVELFNEKTIRKPKKSEFDLNLGFTPSGRFGISAKF